MLVFLRRFAACPLLALALSSCASFGFAKQAIAVTHDSEADQLELRLLYAGVHATQKTSQDFVRAIVDGKRHFIVWDWPWDFDLERLARIDPGAWAEEDEAWPDRPTAERIHAFLEGIEVQEARLFMDGEGRLCLFQRVRLTRVQEGVRLLNQAFCALVREAEEHGQLEGELADARTRDLMLAFVAAGGDFIHLGEGSLEVRIPASGPFAARLVRELMQSHMEQGVVPVAAALGFLRDLRIDDGCLRMTFGPVEDRPPILFLEHPERPASAEALEALEAETLEVLEDEQIQKLLTRPQREDG